MRITTAFILAVLMLGNFVHAAKNTPLTLPRYFDQLNLSPAQKAKIHAIAQTPTTRSRSNQSPTSQKMESRRQQERQLLNNKDFNEDIARKIIAQRHQDRLSDENANAEYELNMLKKRHAIFQVLTPEQQKKYRALQANHP